MTTMEELTKTQIVLLTLLVSFITSVATGIITSTLLAQAPQSITQTINRVVEHTVETVAPVTPSQTTPGATVKEVTVVKEDDAIQQSISSSIGSLVRLSTPLNQTGTRDFYALGVIVSRDGLILSDKRTLIAGGSYQVDLADGSSLSATLVATSDTANLALFKLQADAAHAKGFTPIAVSKTEVKLGQTVIALEGKSKNAVAVGRILTVDADTSRTTTDILPATETQGGILLNLSGELVGLKTSNDDQSLPASVYTTLAPILKLLSR